MVKIEGGRGGRVVEQCGPLFHLKYLKGENLQTYLHLKYIAKPFFSLLFLECHIPPP